MSKELDYIKQVVAKEGKKGRVTVVRWETNPLTGEQRPNKIKVNAMVALSNFEKPLTKRSYTWSKIRPLGVEPYSMGDITEGSLQDPTLRSKIKDALRAEIEAELKMSMVSTDEDTVEKPKKKKKTDALESSLGIEEEYKPVEKPWSDPTTIDPYNA